MFCNFSTYHKGPRWVDILYKDAKLCVIQNGFFSKFFNIGRGCRQGDPISPYLFNLCVEVLGIMIRHNKSIKGIHIGQNEYCLLQYADDTALFLDGSDKSLKCALDLLFQFSKFSGLKPNIDKTHAIWIGSKLQSQVKLCTEYDLNWSNGPFTVLGITFTADLQNLDDLNFQTKILAIEKEINQWSKRNLTPLGRITVVKTLLLPKLTHILISLPKPNDRLIKTLETSFFRYIWCGKKDKIKRSTMVQDYKNGGCKMIHIDSYIKSLKLTWLRRLLRSECSLTKLFCDICNCSLSKLQSCGDYYSNVCACNTTNPFWKETLHILQDFHYKLLLEETDICKMPVWYNSFIKIDNKPYFNESLSRKGINIIQDFLDEHGYFVSYEVFNDMYETCLPFTTYYGIKRACLKAWSQLNNACERVHLPHIPSIVNLLLKDDKGTKLFYNKFISYLDNKCKFPEKWEIDINMENDDWQKINSLIFLSTKNTKLQWLQYRIVHRTLATNKLLKDMKIKDDSKCSFCHNHTETLVHLFFYCPYVYRMWLDIQNWLNTFTEIPISLSVKDIILGICDKNMYVLNAIITTVKAYIYAQRVAEKTDLSIAKVKAKVKDLLELEKYSFKVNGNLK